MFKLRRAKKNYEILVSYAVGHDEEDGCYFTRNARNIKEAKRRAVNELISDGIISKREDILSLHIRENLGARPWPELGR